MRPCDQDGARAMKLWRNALTHFDRMRGMSYEKKIEFSQRLTRAVMKKYKAVVACSFGKDSTVVVHLARQVDPNVRVVFCNTGVEYPETIKFKKLLTNEWNLNLIELNPERSFWACVEEYGYPSTRYLSKEKKEVAKKDKRQLAARTPKCCWYLKEKPAYDWYAENGIEAVLTGITYDESYMRRWTLIRYTCLWFTAKRDMWKCHPIGYWDTEMVWRYTKENNIPVNEAYQKGAKRVGCMPCTGYLSWREEMPKLSFPLYRRVTRELGQPVIEEWG